MPSTRATALSLTLTLTLAATAALGVSAAPTAQATPPPTTCRGQGVDPTAPIRYSSDVVIDAPLTTIWKLQTDVERWPTWQPPVLTADRLDHGPLRKGSRFHWTTPAPATPSTPATTLGITSTVRQLQNHHCILWTGPAIGEGLRIDEGIHLWTFKKARNGIHVHTEETWTGDQVESDIPTATKALAGGLEAWLRDLKSAAESGATQG